MGRYDKIAGPVGYRDSDHIYEIIETGERLFSVTSLLGSLKPKFNDKFMSLKVAEKEIREGNCNIPAEERAAQLRKQWKDKNIRVTTQGTRMHYIFEIFISEKLSFEKTVERFQMNEEEQIYLRNILEKGFQKRKGAVICEDLLYDLHYGIAGQSDVVVEYEDSIDIDDWKFNEKELLLTGYKGQRFEFPLHKYETGDLRVYQLQLSIYMYLKCKVTGKKPGKINVHHFWKGECNTYELEYLEEDVHRLLEFHYWKNRIPNYGNFDLFEGRKSFSKNGDLVEVVGQLGSMWRLRIGRHTEIFSEDETRKLMALPSKSNNSTSLFSGTR